MQKFDLTIKEIIDVKSEITKFVSFEFDILRELEKNNLKFILKKLVFMKYLARQVSWDYRVNAISSDIMYLIRSIQTGEERYYYFNLRSIIEHILRIVNDIDSTNTITNSDIMELTQELITLKKADINLALIKDEYTKSCLFIHGSEKAGMDLAVFYQNCLEEKGMIKDVSVKLNVLVKLLNELFNLILISQNSNIDAAFFGRKTVLKYLIGDSSYSIFEKYQED